MRRAAFAALACLVLAGVRGNAQPGTIKVSGSPATLAIRSTTAAGQPPSSVSDATTTYTIKAPAGPGSVSKMTAQLNAAMPAGVTLTLSAPPTPGGTSFGSIALDATARDIITGIAGFTGNATAALTYTMSASVGAGVIPLQSRTVTLTITAAP